MGSLLALSFFEREKKDLPPLVCRAFLSADDENMAAAGMSQRWCAARYCAPYRGPRPADRAVCSSLDPSLL